MQLSSSNQSQSLQVDNALCMLLVFVFGCICVCLQFVFGCICDWQWSGMKGSKNGARMKGWTKARQLQPLRRQKATWSSAHPSYFVKSKSSFSVWTPFVVMIVMINESIKHLSMSAVCMKNWLPGLVGCIHKKRATHRRLVGYTRDKKDFGLGKVSKKKEI